MYGAFETLSDPTQQRRLLFELGLNFATTEKEKAMYEKAGGEDEDDIMFQCAPPRRQPAPDARPVPPPS